MALDAASASGTGFSMSGDATNQELALVAAARLRFDLAHVK